MEKGEGVPARDAHHGGMQQANDCQIRGKFHPLSVWEKKGYDVAEIEKKGEKTESDMPPVSSWYSPVFANLFTSI